MIRLTPNRRIHTAGTSTIVNILERREYTGCTVNFKTYTNSIWDKKQRENPIENQAVFYNTHPAIIEQEVFDKVQEIRQQRQRKSSLGKTSLFSGLVYCADCKRSCITVPRNTLRSGRISSSVPHPGRQGQVQRSLHSRRCIGANGLEAHAGGHLVCDAV